MRTPFFYCALLVALLSVEAQARLKVRGVATGQNGAPIAGALVVMDYCQPAPGSGVGTCPFEPYSGPEARSATDGSFEFNQPRPGDYAVFAIDAQLFERHRHPAATINWDVPLLSPRGAPGSPVTFALVGLHEPIVPRIRLLALPRLAVLAVSIDSASYSRLAPDSRFVFRVTGGDAPGVPHWPVRGISFSGATPPRRFDILVFAGHMSIGAAAWSASAPTPIAGPPQYSWQGQATVPPGKTGAIDIRMH